MTLLLFREVILPEHKSSHAHWLIGMKRPKWLWPVSASNLWTIDGAHISLGTKTIRTTEPKHGDRKSEFDGV
jgi:hypothetical protein